jgi:hypothetical protein
MHLFRFWLSCFLALSMSVFYRDACPGISLHFSGYINIAHLHCRTHTWVPRVNTFEISLHKSVHIRQNARPVTFHLINGQESPCGGGLEFLHRNSVRRRRWKGNPMLGGEPLGHAVTGGH